MRVLYLLECHTIELGCLNLELIISSIFSVGFVKSFSESLQLFSVLASQHKIIVFKGLTIRDEKSFDVFVGSRTRM